MQNPAPPPSSHPLLSFPLPSQGDGVIGGTINMEGLIHVQATKLGDESMLAQILKVRPPGRFTTKVHRNPQILPGASSSTQNGSSMIFYAGFTDCVFFCFRLRCLAAGIENVLWIFLLTIFSKLSISLYRNAWPLFIPYSHFLK